jgi:L-alanine-DL-glutamate epimerase-like enolase superfamily enzyme
MVAVLTAQVMSYVREEEFEVRIVKAEAFLCDVEVETVRTDAIQSFAKQETIFVDIETEDGLVGTGYSYTIGTGGRAVLQLLHAQPPSRGGCPAD